MYTANQIADYVIFRLISDEDQAELANLKLQKLLYYIQAWHLAFFDKVLFEGKFQAWIHGPVNREVYDRFKESKYLYSSIEIKDIQNVDLILDVTTDDRIHINTVLDSYAKFSATELEIMTHREDPWIQARKGYSDTQRCEKEIDEIIMKNYYKKRLAN
jgi:uncharacterized phage-associated protein